MVKVSLKQALDILFLAIAPPLYYLYKEGLYKLERQVIARPREAEEHPASDRPSN